MTRTDKARIHLTAQTVANIAELLERCDELVRHPDPAVRAALAGYLALPAGGYEYNLLIDQLGFTALMLGDQLAATEAEQARTSGGL